MTIYKEEWLEELSKVFDTWWIGEGPKIKEFEDGSGQYHKNCYSISKIRDILKRINFEEIEIWQSKWKGDKEPIINVHAIKGSV